MPTAEPEPSLLTKLKTSYKRTLRRFGRFENENNLREAIEELIEEGAQHASSIESDERELLGNVLNLRELTAAEVMVPRADIIAVPENVLTDELIATFIHSRLSYLPVYRNTLDEVIGMIQLKDVFSWKVSGKPLNIRILLRDVAFISPALPTLDLLLMMRESGQRMAMVVDEYGGVDGLVTMSDLVEEIIGDIQNAQDNPLQQMLARPDGSWVVDGRVTLEEMAEVFNVDLTPQNPEDDDIATVGGLVSSLVGRVPSRGELITHPKGYEIEVLDADPRRIKRLCIRPIILDANKKAL